jgi:hypothetical protein
LAILVLLGINAFLINIRAAYFYINYLPLYWILAYYFVVWAFFANLATGKKKESSELVDKPSQV